MSIVHTGRLTKDYDRQPALRDLDPVEQREFHAHLREFADAGGTALFSSHVLSEVEQVAWWGDARVTALKAKAHLPGWPGRGGST